MAQMPKDEDRIDGLDCDLIFSITKAELVEMNEESRKMMSSGKGMKFSILLSDEEIAEIAADSKIEILPHFLRTYNNGTQTVRVSVHYGPDKCELLDLSLAAWDRLSKNGQHDRHE